MDDGKFREDLFFRLDVVNITLPPLRDRLEDVTLLCDFYIQDFLKKNGKTIQGITPDAMNILARYAWPGNVRELRNTMEKTIVLARGDRITARDIPPNIRNAVRDAGGDAPPESRPAGGHRSESLAETERAMIFAALKKQGQNRTKAAKELGISRRTLHRKLREYAAEAQPEAPGDGKPADI